ncbi:DinB family protein [Pedobacter psychrodurus]|uniref:DinB family protein n=1 Tax=Pedobacter psychrodurus TaxID=2530456 RepID=A0A4R0Q4I7_9SPHI|nr:DinB family protein [Pedobacter psychrodurus]TCD26192.1 DinB family protein [Pedobacter psychrodurus]
MKTTPTSSRMYGFIVLYEMQTDFLIRALDGIDQKDAQKRLEKANHIAWITGSVVHGRYFLAKSFGIDIPSITDELFANNKGIIDDATYPSLADFIKDWAAISPKLQEALTQATDEKLEEKLSMPGMEITLFEMISFSSYREANCIGQIALWRRLLGYPGMNYM